MVSSSCALRLAGIALGIALSCSSSRPARAQTDVRDEVVRLLDARPLRTDLVVVVDSSGSMAKHFGAVRSFVGDLGKLARPGDTITFISFAERAGELMPPVKIEAGSAARLRARLAQLRLPRGQFTDLGAGIEATLDTLLRPGFAPVSMVFFVTDFCAEPPPGSAYAGEIEGAGPCRSVRASESSRRKSAQLLNTGDQAIRAIALALEPASTAGLEAARTAFGSLIRVDVTQADLEGALDGMRARMQYDRADLEVERFLRKAPFAIANTHERLPLVHPTNVSFEIRTPSPLPVTIGQLSIRALDGTVEFELDRPDHERRKLELVQGRPLIVKARAKNIAEKAARWSPARSTRDVEIELEADYELSPRGPITKLIGRTPAAQGSVRKTIRFELAPPDPSDPAVALAPERGGESVLVSPGTARQIALALTSSIGWADVDVRCVVEGKPQEPVVLRPGSAASFAVAVRNDAESHPWRLFTEERKAVTISGKCDVVAVAGDGSRIPRGTHPIQTAVTLVWDEGVLRSLIAALLLGIIAGVFAWFREVAPRFAPARLAGRLVIYEGPGEFRRVTVPLGGRARFDVAGVAAAEGAEARVDGDRLVLPGVEGTSAEIYAEKSGKKSVMRLRQTQGDAVMLGESPLGPGPIVIRRGRARFSIGEYHCRVD